MQCGLDRVVAVCYGCCCKIWGSPYVMLPGKVVVAACRRLPPGLAWGGATCTAGGRGRSYFRSALMLLLIVSSGPVSVRLVAFGGGSRGESCFEAGSFGVGRVVFSGQG